MVTLRFDGVYWFILRDGVEVANTGALTVAKAVTTTGLRVERPRIKPLDAVAAMVGADAVRAVSAHRRSIRLTR